MHTLVRTWKVSATRTSYVIWLERKLSFWQQNLSVNGQQCNSHAKIRHVPSNDSTRECLRSAHVSVTSVCVWREVLFINFASAQKPVKILVESSSHHALGRTSFGIKHLQINVEHFDGIRTKHSHSRLLRSRAHIYHERAQALCQEVFELIIRQWATSCTWNYFAKKYKCPAKCTQVARTTRTNGLTHN